MEMLERVVLDHFNAGRGEGGSMPGRVIIFTNLRESVQHIVCMLNLHSDAIGAKYEPHHHRRTNSLPWTSQPMIYYLPCDVPVQHTYTRLSD
jgi:hypothetical protein